MGYIDQAYGNEHKEVAQMIGTEMISPRFIAYLIQRDDILVHKHNGDHLACAAISKPRRNRIEATGSYQTGPNTGDKVTELGYPRTGAPDCNRETVIWNIKTQTWKLDGYFRKHSEQMLLKVTYQDVQMA